MIKLQDKYNEFRPTRYRQYYRVASIPAQVVVDAIRAGDETIKLGDDISVGITSQRIQTYGKGVACVHCGIEGKFFAVERMLGDNKYHLNVYHIREDGKEVMITSDHIIPKSKGGSNMASNRNPMCEPHNVLKGSYDTVADAIEAHKAAAITKQTKKEQIPNLQGRMLQHLKVYEMSAQMAAAGNPTQDWAKIMARMSATIDSFIFKGLGIRMLDF